MVRDSLRGVWALACALACALAWGCGAEELPQQPYEPAVRAVWDPSSGVVPTPTDLLRDPATGQLGLPIDDVTSPADREFRGYLNSLDGWPVTSTVSIPVSGPVDDVTLAGTVVLARESDGARLRVDARYDAEAGAIVVTPESAEAPGEEPALEGGESYVYGLWGYESGARGAQGEDVVADAAFYLIRAGQPLTEHVDALPGDTRAEREETARALEDVRLGYEGLYALMGRYGVPREQIATLGRFRVTGRPSVWFDPNLGKIPTPNDLLLDRETGLVSLPVDPEDDEEELQFKAKLQEYDGFASSAAVVMEATAPVDASSLERGVRVFKVLEGGEVREHTDLERGVLDDGVTFWARPRLAFDAGAQYVYVATRGVTAAGERLTAQPVGALLGVSAPLVSASGESEISSIGDSTATTLEPARRDTQAVLEALEREGIPRSEVAAVVPFRTASASSFLMDYRARVYEQDVPTGLVNALEKTPLERGLPFVLSRVRTIVTGQIAILDHLDPTTRAFYEDGSSELGLADFVLTIPESATPGEPVKTVVFGHGLLTSRELTYLVANTLARAGWATISVDLPYHGERSVCLQDLDCVDDYACNPQGVCVGPAGERGDLERIRGVFADGPTYPVTSGTPFIDLEHIAASRDHFIQSVMDISQLVRVVRGADWAKASGGYVLDGDDVVYLGMSLGGILGAVLATVEPTIGTYVLNVPGGSLFDIVENSGAFSSLFDDALERRGITSRSGDDYFDFENAIRWILDPVDPLNIAYRAIREPLDYVDPVDGQTKQTPIKRVMLQMARGDSVVPNEGTRLLSERMGVPFREYTPQISNHAFLFDPLDPESVRARGDMVDFFEQR